MGLFRLRRGRAACNRLRRRAGFDRNPMRRAVDRLQWATGLGMLILFLAVAPVAATSVFDRVYTAGLRAERAQAQQTERAQAQQTQKASTQEAQSRYTRGSQAGAPESTPLRKTRTDTVADSTLAGLVAGAAAAVPFLSGYLLLRRRLDRRREHSWDEAWARFDRRHAA